MRPACAQSMFEHLLRSSRLTPLPATRKNTCTHSIYIVVSFEYGVKSGRAQREQTTLSCMVWRSCPTLWTRAIRATRLSRSQIWWKHVIVHLSSELILYRLYSLRGNPQRPHCTGAKWCLVTSYLGDIFGRVSGSVQEWKIRIECRMPKHAFTCALQVKLRHQHTTPQLLKIYV